MDFEIRLLMLIILLALSINLMFIFRKYAVVIYVAVWFFIPNQAENLIGIEGVPLYTFVEIVSSIILLMIALSSSSAAHNNFQMSKYSILSVNFELKIVYFFATMIFFQTVLSVVMLNSYQINIPIAYIIQNFTREFAGVIFLFACIKLIKTKEQVENIMYVFVIATILLSLEILIVKLIPSLFFLSFTTIFVHQGMYSG